jgi:hypothetical protein
MILTNHINGNAHVVIHDDGTRIIECENDLQLEYPLNVDIRVSTACSLGFNPKTGKAICAFCHESARVDGDECDYRLLKEKVLELPMGTELAIGGNRLTPGLTDFLIWATMQGYICNLTVNQLHMGREQEKLKSLLETKTFRGLGISYRKDYPLNVPEYFIEHPNVVLHVIAGIDEVDDILRLPFKKVLVLGYKTFGFGKEYYSEEVENNLERWRWWVSKLFEGRVVSFDNLSVEQLRIKRFFTKENWQSFYQGEHSFYIDAVAGQFAPSSRSPERTKWDIPIIDYFKRLQ